MIKADQRNYKKARGPFTDFERASKQVDQKARPRSAAFNWQYRPMKVPGDVFKKTADTTHATNKLTELSQQSLPVSHASKKYGQMDEEEKRQELAMLKGLDEDRLNLLQGSAAEEHRRN